jgi:hypothetical protein
MRSKERAEEEASMELRRTSPPSHRRRAMVGGLMAAVAAGIFLWPHAPAEPFATGAPVVAPAGKSPPADVAPAAKDIRPWTGDRGWGARNKPAPPANAEAARLPRSARLTFDQVDDPRLFGLSPGILYFVDIQRKALRSREDLDEALALASDRGLIDEAARELSRHDPGEQQALARRRRIALVDFLKFALVRGHEAAYAAQTISEIVAHGATAEGEPLEIRKAFAGDRVELVLALKGYAPDAFKNLRTRAAGTPAERIVAYAASLDPGHEKE